MKKTAAIALLLCLVFVACDKDKNEIRFDYVGPCHCGVENPLNDLQWLHITALHYETMRGKRRAEISVCTYDSTRQGFLLSGCLDCPDYGTAFFDCEGNDIGLVWGFDGTPLSAYNIDPESVHVIYRNFPDTAATLVGKRWVLESFFDRQTNTTEYPTNGNDTLRFWLLFNEDSTVVGGGINQLGGQYAIRGHRIAFNIQCLTEIYDSTGWEERMLEALYYSYDFAVDYYGKNMRIYYDLNRKWMDFSRVEN